MANNVISKQMVSEALTTLNELLKLVNTSFGTSVIQVGGAALAFGSMGQMLTRFLLPALKAAYGLFGPWGIAIAAVTTAVLTFTKAWKNSHPSLEKTNMLISDANAQLLTNKERLEKIEQMPWYEKTSDILNEKAALEQENAELEKNISNWQERSNQLTQKEARKTLDESLDLLNKTVYRVTSADPFENVSNVFGTMEEVAEDLGISLEELTASIENGKYSLESMAMTSHYTGEEIDNVLISTLQDLTDKMLENKGLTEEEQLLYEQVTEAARERSNANKVLGNSYEEVDKALSKAERSYELVTRMTQQLAEKNNETAQSSNYAKEKLKELLEQYPSLSQAIKVANGEIRTDIKELTNLSDVSIDTKRAVFELVAQMDIFNNADLDISQKVIALRELALEAGVAASALANALSGVAGGDIESQVRYIMSFDTSISREQAEQAAYSYYLKDYSGKITEAPDTAAKGGGGGSSSDATLGALQKIVSLRESELSLMKERGDSEDDQIAKIREIQSALHDEAEYLRSIGGSEEEINKLSTSWWKYQKEIVELEKNSEQNGANRLNIIQDTISLLESELDLMEQRGDSETDQIAKIQEIQSALHEEAEYLRSTKEYLEGDVETLKKVNELSSSWWQYQNRINSLQEDALDKIREQYRLMSNELGKQIDGYTALSNIMQDYADEKIKELQSQLDALEQTNNELDKQIEYEEKLDAIAKARESKVMVYKDGRFQYVEDIDAVSAAQSDLEQFEREQLRETEKQAIEDEIDTLQEYKSQWGDLADEYRKQSERQLAYEQFHLDEERSNWDEILANASAYVTQYNAIMGRLGDVEAIASGEKPIPVTTRRNSIFADVDYNPNVDYAQKMIDAVQSGRISDALLYAAQREAKIKAEGIQGVESTADMMRRLGLQGYASGTLSASGGFSLVGERGAELRVLGKGDGIIPADITANLWKWGSMNPSTVLSKIGGNNGKMSVTIETLNLPNVIDGAGFVDYVRNNLYGQVLSFVH